MLPHGEKSVSIVDMSTSNHNKPLLFVSTLWTNPWQALLDKLQCSQSADRRPLPFCESTHTPVPGNARELTLPGFAIRGKKPVTAARNHLDVKCHTAPGLQIWEQSSYSCGQRSRNHSLQHYRINEQGWHESLTAGEAVAPIARTNSSRCSHCLGPKTFW